MLSRYLVRKYTMMALRPITSRCTYTVRRGLAKGLKRRGGFGFLPTRLAPLGSEEAFLLDLNLEGKTIYDVGGYQGVFTMFFSRKVGETGQVITFEPNPVNYNWILENLELNEIQNVEVRPMGVGRESRDLELVFDPKDPGEGSFHEEFQNRNRRSKQVKAIQVRIDSLDNQIFQKDSPRPDFVKIDVEGLEMDVLQGMSKTLKECKPQLFIELHGVNDSMTSENSKKVFQLLDSADYSIYHVEEGEVLNSESAGSITGGHIYCT